ncbi:MAG: serine racemase VanT catalytic subunit, partial [Gemmiger sp.]
SGYFLASRGWKNLRRFWLHTVLIYLAAVALYLPLNLYTGDSAAQWLRGLVWEGTVYHLWYFPALLWGVLLARALTRLGMPAALGIAGALYLMGLGGDSYFGLITRLPAAARWYATLFTVTDYTRNGLFYAPLFLLLGAALAGQPVPRSCRGSALGLAAGLTALTAESFLLRGLSAQRHDSMYLLLPVCMVFLFRLLLGCNTGRSRAARDLSLLIYLLHPGCIVAVRGLAKHTGTRPWLLDNSLGHFGAVLILTLAAALLLYRLRPLPLPANARAWRELDADALRGNLHALQQAAGPDCRVMAVVKADAYGHGARPVSRLLQREGVRDFAVACLQEGIALRKGGIRGAILVLGWTDPRLAPLLARWRLTQAVTSLEHGQALAASGCRVRVHLALDTGMHRIGMDARDHEALARLYALPGLRITGVFSHLCVSDDLSPEGAAFTRRQAETFREALAWLKGQGLAAGRVHLLASYGILNTPESSFDLVRAGIALYGVYSDDTPTRRPLALQPVLSLKARVALVRALAPGESAGYGLAFTAARPARLAVLAIGYADGLPRCLPQQGGRVLLHGASCPMVGRMCMDQLLVDVTDAPAVTAGDTATLIGRDGDSHIPVEEVARRCGTISNEILSRLGSRLALRH